MGKMTRSTPHRRGSAAAALAAVVALCASVPALAAPERRDSVLVKLDPSASRAERAAVWDALGAATSRGLPGGWRAYRLPDDVTLSQARRDLAATDADVAVELDHVVRPVAAPNDPQFVAGNQYGLTAISAPVAWDLFPGAGTAPLVAVVDTGVKIDHPDLGDTTNPIGDHIWTNGADGTHGWHIWVDRITDPLHPVERTNTDVFPASPADEHGTHVAGIIGAVANNAAGVAGVAGPDAGPGQPSVRIMTVRFLDPDGTDSTASQALAFATSHGAKVINASWGGLHSTPLCQSILNASSSALVVIAAGNESSNNDLVPTSPADCRGPGIISVAATTAADALATFSNFGPNSVDMAAPGEDITSTLPLGYGLLSGTSMAAPQVTGAAALMLRADPSLTPALLRRGLVKCGDPLPDLAATIASGRRLNAANSLAQAVSRTTLFDGVPPCPFALQGPGDGATVGARPSFSWTGSDDLRSGVASYRVSLDGTVVASAAGSAVTAAPVSDLAQGAHTWTVEAVDGAGNVRAASTTRRIVVDSGPPDPFSLTEPAAGLATRSRAPLMQWSATTDTGVGLAGYQLLVDGIAGPVMAPNVLAGAPASPLPDGNHTWQVRALDALNQARDSEVRSFLVDTVAPKPFFLRSPVDGARIGTRRPSLLWSRTLDPGSGRVTFVVLVDGKPRAKALTKPSWRATAPLRPGRHTWRVRAVDAAGNTRLSPPGTFVIR